MGSPPRGSTSSNPVPLQQRTATFHGPASHTHSVTESAIRRMPGSSPTFFVRGAAAAFGFAFIAACATAGTTSAPAATEAEWRVLASPRPSPVPGAPRLALTGVEMLAAPPWSLESPVPLSLGASELVVAGLLRRADVRFVERRRFAAAAEAERGGGPRPRGAPPAGVSDGAELVATVVWAPLAAGQASLEIRLADAATGAVRGTRRVLLPRDADPVALARQAVAGILAALAELGRLPEWSDPVPAAAPPAFAPSGVPLRAVEAFLAGLAAEESWRWEPARESYQAATVSIGFVEAEAALARAARLRLGGTLGES